MSHGAVTFAPRGGEFVTGVPRDRMYAAALVIARQAQANAAPWSEQIPPSVFITASDGKARISSAAPPAYPNEVPRVRHPVFGNREVWVTNQYRPFLVPAAELKADEAAAEIGKSIDDIAHDAGFKGTG